MIKLFQSILGANTDFEKIFFKNEYLALSGVRWRTIISLLGILFFTFLALGFAVGSINNLKQKMDNPFTNWVNLDIDNYVSSVSGNIIKRYNEPENQLEFSIDTTNGFARYNLSFYHKDFLPFKHNPDTLLRRGWGRTIEFDEPLLDKILDAGSGNLIWQSEELYDEGELSWNDAGVIISKKLMERLNYVIPDSMGYIGATAQLERRTKKDTTTSMVWFPVKVLAVVKELPDVDFVSSPRFFNGITAALDARGRQCGDLLIEQNREGDKNFHILLGDLDQESSLRRLANEFFPKKKPGLYLQKELLSGGKIWGICELSFLPAYQTSLDTFIMFIDSAQSMIPVSELAYIDTERDDCGFLQPRAMNYLAFNFEDLSHIRNFKEDMDKEFRVTLDMRQVEAKENFALVSSLTFAISLILLAFGVLSIVLFVNNLLRTHLFEVRSNLGTFQAFGLENKFLVRIYLKIILAFLSLSIVIAYLLSLGVDILEGVILQEESRFDITNIWILAAIVGLLLISLSGSYFTIRRILGDTPGNLIYER
jgi:hypothetical protein